MHFCNTVITSSIKKKVTSSIVENLNNAQAQANACHCAAAVDG